MVTRLRRKPKPFELVLTLAAILTAGLLLASYFKPLPTYLVAARDLVPGQQLSEADLMSVSVELGEAAPSYLASFEAGLTPIAVIRSGELIPINGLTLNREGRTQIRFTPTVEVAQTTQVGSWVALWQVVELEERYEAQLIVPRAEVAALIEPDGLFANDLRDLEVLVSEPQATLIMRALASDLSLFAVPVR
jgi:hypothetical protein